MKLLQTLQLRNQNPNLAPEDEAFAKPSTNSQDLPRFRFVTLKFLINLRYDQSSSMSAMQIENQTH